MRAKMIYLGNIFEIGLNMNHISKNGASEKTLQAIFRLVGKYF